MAKQRKSTIAKIKTTTVSKPAGIKTPAQPRKPRVTLTKNGK
jgi:hypothetical protein